MTADHPNRRTIVSIVGGKSGSPALLEAAERIGRGLVNAGFRIATGGLGGVMSAASKGGRQANGWREGRVLGILPSLDAETANPWVDVAIPTGLSHARNVVLVTMSDVVVAIGGGAGTLSEIALAWQHGKTVVGLDLGEGWSARLAGARIDDRRSDSVHRAETPEEVVRLVVCFSGVPAGV